MKFEVGDNLAFGDELNLTKCLKKNVTNGAEIGSDYYLEKFDTQRRSKVFLEQQVSTVRLYTDNKQLV